MAGPWRVRFVSHDVLEALGPEFKDHWDPDVLRLATERLGYLPWVTWSYRGDADPSGVFAVCPLCYQIGSLAFRQSPNDPGRVIWQFNGDMDSPTLSPSVLRIADRLDKCVMHVWVRDGQIIDAGTPTHGGTA